MVTEMASSSAVPRVSIRVHHRLAARLRSSADGSIPLEHVFAAVSGIAGQRPVARVDDKIQQFQFVSARWAWARGDRGRASPRPGGPTQG